MKLDFDGNFSEEVIFNEHKAHNGFCRIRGCVNKIHSFHHRLCNTDSNRKLFPLFLICQFNCAGLCELHHRNHASILCLDITEEEAEIYERFLKKMLTNSDNDDILIIKEVKKSMNKDKLKQKGGEMNEEKEVKVEKKMPITKAIIGVLSSDFISIEDVSTKIASMYSEKGKNQSYFARRISHILNSPRYQPKNYTIEKSEDGKLFKLVKK